MAAPTPTCRWPARWGRARDALHDSAALRSLLGDPLIDAFVAIKRHEHAEREALADPRTDWDLAHLIELG